MSEREKLEDFVSIDLETTGLNPKRDRIIEIGAVKYLAGQQAGIYHVYVNPGRKLEARITELTGITQEQVDKAPYIEEVLPELCAFLEELPILGHRVLFDFSFLKQAAVNQDIPFEKTAVDTLQIARKYLSELPDRSLKELCKYYGIPHEAHRAYEDAQATAALYRILEERFFSPGEPLFMPRRLEYRVKKETPATKSQKEQLYRLIDRHKLAVDYDVEKLMRSEASRLLDKIFTQHGRPGR